MVLTWWMGSCQWYENGLGPASAGLFLACVPFSYRGGMTVASPADGVNQRLFSASERNDAILYRVHGRGLPEDTRIDLTYYRSQAEYDRYGRDRGPYRQVNAVSLHAGLLLRQAGYVVAYVAPQDLPPVERSGIRLTRDTGASGRI